MGATPVTLVDLITKRLADLGVSQREAARQLGVPSATMSRWTNGISVPSPESVPSLAAWLDEKPKRVEALADEARVAAARSVPASIRRLVTSEQTLVDEMRKDHRRMLDRLRKLEREVAELKARLDA